MSDNLRDIVTDPANSLTLSVVSVWEISVKNSLGKLPLPNPPHEFISRWRTMHGIESLPLRESAVFHLSQLPPLHHDPFDRMLVCQALADNMVILTPDEHISRYSAKTLWQ